MSSFGIDKYASCRGHQSSILPVYHPFAFLITRQISLFFQGIPDLNASWMSTTSALASEPFPVWSSRSSTSRLGTQCAYHGSSCQVFTNLWSLTRHQFKYLGKRMPQISLDIFYELAQMCLSQRWPLHMEQRPRKFWHRCAKSTPSSAFFNLLRMSTAPSSTNIG
jgi:hypothetical protein